jgi:hypothetical protein
MSVAGQRGSVPLGQLLVTGPNEAMRSFVGSVGRKRPVSNNGFVKVFTPPKKRPRYSLDRKMGGPQNRSRLCGEEKHLAPTENPTRPSSPYPVEIPRSTLHLLFTCFLSLSYSQTKANGAKGKHQPTVTYGPLSANGPSKRTHCLIVGQVPSNRPKRTDTREKAAAAQQQTYIRTFRHTNKLSIIYINK